METQIKTEHFPGLDWIDDFVKSIKPYVKVRAYDNILILIPTEAYVINKPAVAILKHVLGGGSIKDIEKKRRLTIDEKKDIHYFFCDLHALVRGCLRETQNRRAVEKIPFAGSFNTLPVLSEIALTYRCNLRCRFCYASCNCQSSKQAVAELTTEEVKCLLDIIAFDAEVPSTSFTGGEPILRDDLAELIRYARKNLRVNLITNATLATEEKVAELVNAGLNSVQISIEGPNARTHDSLTGVAGSFEKTIQGIKNFKASGIHTHTNTTITRLNAPFVADIVDVIKDLGLAKLSMNMVIPSGSAGTNNEKIQIPYREIGPIVMRVKERAEKAGITFLWYSPTPMCMFNPISEGLGNKACAACDGLLSIAPNGELLPCSSYPEFLGNVLERDFKKLWKSRRVRYFTKKKFLPALCKKCEYAHICTGACPIYWEKCGYKELEEVTGRNGYSSASSKTR